MLPLTIEYGGGLPLLSRDRCAPARNADALSPSSAMRGRVDIGWQRKRPMLHTFSSCFASGKSRENGGSNLETTPCSQPYNNSAIVERVAGGLPRRVRGPKTQHFERKRASRVGFRVKARSRCIERVADQRAGIGRIGERGRRQQAVLFLTRSDEKTAYARVDRDDTGPINLQPPIYPRPKTASR